MRATISLIASTALLAACGSDTSGTVTGEDGETVAYKIDEENGETTATITTDEGTAVITTGENVKLDLPAGFTVYPGAKVVHNTNVNQNGNRGAMVVMESDAAADKIAAFYREQAEDAGIKVEFEMSMEDGQMLGGTSEEGRSFTLNTSAAEDLTTIQLMVGQETS